MPWHFGGTRFLPPQADQLSELAILMWSANDSFVLADLVVVCLHCDLEFSFFPSPGRVRLCRRLIDQGAHLVIQHHPHVCQGIEEYKDGLIAYSLGNFVFPVAGNAYMDKMPGTDWGLLLYVDVSLGSERPRLAWQAMPITIDTINRTLPSSGDRREEQLRALTVMSQGLRDPQKLRREWRKRCMREARSTYHVLAHVCQRNGLAEMLREGIKLARSPYERRWIYGLLTGGVSG